MAVELTYCFPDDRSESFEAFRYPKIGWLAIAEYMAVACRTYGLPIGDGTFQRWIRMLAYVYALDRMIDDGDDDGRPADWRSVAKDVIEASLRGSLPVLPSWVSPHVAHAHNLLWSSINELGPSAKSALLVAGSHGVEASIRKSKARSVRQYLRAIRLENHALADLAIALMTTQERNRNLRALRRLRTYLRRLLAQFGVKDALGDLRSDRDKDLTLVEPTESNHRRLRDAGRLSALGLVVFHPIASARVAWRTYEFWNFNGVDDWRKWQQQIGRVVPEVKH